MRLLWTAQACEDYLFWQRTDPRILQFVNELIRDTKRSPFRGLGKPELLKHDLKGWWSRRISGEHRLVYRVTGTGDRQQLEIALCRFHYQ